MGLHMNYVKVYGFIAAIPVLFGDANAMNVNDYSITLTDDPKLDELYKKDEYRAMASEILRQHYNAHLAKVRMEKKSELVQWDNETYNESVYGVILNEIARCFFDINNDMVTYNQFNGKMIECVGTDPLKYDAANWNYVFLVNFIDRFMANVVDCFSTNAFKQLFDRALKDTKEAILNANTKDGYMCDYATYKDAIESAYSDIKEYCAQLQLSDYLIELMKVRLRAATIKYKWIFKKDKEGNEVKTEIDYEDARKQYKDFITKIKASPNNEKNEHIEEFIDNEWIRMTLNLPGIKIWNQHNKVLHIRYRTLCIRPYITRIEKYHARQEYHICIDQPNATALFKTYRIDFGKITEVCKNEIPLDDNQIPLEYNPIRVISHPKYIKLSDNKWYNNKTTHAEWREDKTPLTYTTRERTYEGFHPLDSLKGELLRPKYFNEIYRAKKTIDGFGDTLLETHEIRKFDDKMQILTRYGMNKPQYIDTDTDTDKYSDRTYIYTARNSDFRAHMKLVYSIPWRVWYRRGKDLFDEKANYCKLLENEANEIESQLKIQKEITHTEPTEDNMIKLKKLVKDLEEINTCKSLLCMIGATNAGEEKTISKYKQYEAIMTVYNILQSIINELNSYHKTSYITTTIELKSTQNIKQSNDQREYVEKLNKQIKKLKTATNMLPSDETIEKAKNIILEILQIKETEIKQNNDKYNFWKKLNGEYRFSDESAEAKTGAARTYLTGIKNCITSQLEQKGWSKEDRYDIMRGAKNEAFREDRLYEYE